MNYIISWIIVKFISTNCPNLPIQNEFGVVQSSYNTCLVNHVKEEKFPNKKEFTNKKESISFLKKLEEYSKYQESQISVDNIKIIEIKIDSVTINK